jgi:hypothetical protein
VETSIKHVRALLLHPMTQIPSWEDTVRVTAHKKTN